MANRVSSTTTDHDTIRQWAEARGGQPAQVASTARGGKAGIIRIDFPGYSGAGKLAGPSPGTSGSRSSTTRSWRWSTRRAPPRASAPASTSWWGARTARAREQGVKASRRTLRSGSGRARPAARSGSGRREASRAVAARTTRAGRTSRTSSAKRGSTSRAGTSARGRKSAGRSASSAGGRKGASRKSTGRTSSRKGRRSKS
ncbi:MAG: hypothetical protein QM767_09035 [Anaeromyxobacter sp.]